MPTYPLGTPSSGIYDIFEGTSFTPSDVVKAIRDNQSPVNRTTMLNSLGYQVGLIQNYVNATYLGREEYPVGDSWVTSGHFIDVAMSSSGLGTADSPEYVSSLTKDYVRVVIDGGASSSVCGHFQSDGVLWFSSTIAENNLWLKPASGYYFQYMRMLTPCADTNYTGWLYTPIGHELAIFNMGHDSNPAWLGHMTVSGYQLNLYAKGGSYRLSDSPYFSWEAGGLTFSGNSTSTVAFYNDIRPLVNKSSDLGSVTYQWEEGYINRIRGWATDQVGGSLYYNIGFLCGQPIAETWPVLVKRDYGILSNSAGVRDNALMLRQEIAGNATATTSGYFRINTQGQTEFYSLEHGSGWVLTNF